MGLILRQDLDRKMTLAELDANLTYLESIAGSGSGTSSGSSYNMDVFVFDPLNDGSWFNNVRTVSKGGVNVVNGTYNLEKPEEYVYINVSFDRIGFEDDISVGLEDVDSVLDSPEFNLYPTMLNIGSQSSSATFRVSFNSALSAGTHILNVKSTGGSQTTTKSILFNYGVGEAGSGSGNPAFDVESSSPRVSALTWASKSGTTLTTPSLSNLVIDEVSSSISGVSGATWTLTEIEPTVYQLTMLSGITSVGVTKLTSMTLTLVRYSTSSVSSGDLWDVTGVIQL